VVWYSPHLYFQRTSVVYEAEFCLAKFPPQTKQGICAYILGDIHADFFSPLAVAPEA